MCELFCPHHVSIHDLHKSAIQRVVKCLSSHSLLLVVYTTILVLRVHAYNGTVCMRVSTKITTVPARNKLLGNRIEIGLCSHGMFCLDPRMPCLHLVPMMFGTAIPTPLNILELSLYVLRGNNIIFTTVHPASLVGL